MFAIDNRTGNVIPTVALFAIAAVVLYVARGVGQKNRTGAIALVYLIGTLGLGIVGYAFAPHLVAQIKSFNAEVPQILQGLYSGKTAADLGARHGLNADE